MEELTIGEAARRANLQPSTLRYYEQVGLLPVPRRVHGRRHYEYDVVQRLRVIKVAQQAGFTLAEIATLLHGFAEDIPPSARWHVLAQRKLHEIDVLLAQVQAMKHLLEAGLQCNCSRLDECAVCSRSEE